jgi:D-sedoheptulose 7-phosphate isomerase
MKKEILFLKKYQKDFQELLKESFDKNTDKLIKIKNIFVNCSKKGGKLIIIGNGGSSSISSHFSVDITKNAGLRCVNFNEPDLITCFANDYGYEKWAEKAIDFYADKSDVVILISSSGCSKNIINAGKFSKKRGINTITFTGNNKNNPLKKLGNINLWVDSKAYNYVENIHQIFLLSIVDLLIGKSVYSA